MWRLAALAAFICMHPNSLQFNNKILSTRANFLKDALVSENNYKPIVEPLTNIKTKIKEVIPNEHIEAVQIRHIELETEQMALLCKQVLVDEFRTSTR
jgi:hypothetical protein